MNKDLRSDDSTLANAQFASTWNQFSLKYNSLVEIMETKGINISLLDEVLESKIELTKEAVKIKIEELFKI